MAGEGYEYVPDLEWIIKIEEEQFETTIQEQVYVTENRDQEEVDEDLRKKAAM